MKPPGSNTPRKPSSDGEQAVLQARVLASAPTPANDIRADDHPLVDLVDDLAVLLADLCIQGRLDEIPDFELKGR